MNQNPVDVQAALMGMAFTFGLTILHVTFFLYIRKEDVKLSRNSAPLAILSWGDNSGCRTPTLIGFLLLSGVVMALGIMTLILSFRLGSISNVIFDSLPIAWTAIAVFLTLKRDTGH